ncbi:hypothetical protein J7E49_18220 [Variovorax paradoxus]|nr:hypothetical protein [Variovorax paradoxus]
MALICPVCSAENREGANFCRRCGGKLAPTAPAPMAPPPGPDGGSEREWAATAPAQLRAATIPGELYEAGAHALSAASSASARLPENDKTLILAPGLSERASSRQREARAKKKSSSRTRPRRPADAEAQRKPSRSRGMWLWVVLLAVGLLMIIAGWYGYGRTDRPAEELPQIATPAAPPVAPAPLPEPPAAMPESAAPEAPSEETAAPMPAPTTPAAANSKAPPAAAKPRKPAPAAPLQPGATEPVPAAVVAPPSSPAPAAPTDPLALCGDRNFIAKAQCMAAQCLKPEYKPHAQCEAVRRQQRIEEEKRNPTN